MFEIIDKILLFLFSLVLYLFHDNIGPAVIPAILSIILSSLFYYYDDHRIRLIGILSYSVLCLFLPGYIIFLPLLLYDIFYSRFQYIAVILLLLFYINRYQYPFYVFLFTILFSILSYIIKYKTEKMNGLRYEYNELRDSSSSFSQILEEKNRSILKNQDYEINLATLNERNRISREIHDNIGHLLSRALLQVGALLTISKDEIQKEGLSDLKDSLSQGMDDIRSSIHKMYDESIDLYSQVEQLVNNFSFCPIHFEYDISTPPPLVVKHSLIAIIKEALANIMRHSNGNKASILLREHPAMYQLIISDNGTISDNKKKILQNMIDRQEEGEGMGLKNIINRVSSFGGNLNISLDKGFQIFISIPKGNKSICIS